MKINFEAAFEVPDGTPIADVEAWLRFELGIVAHLAGDNALVKLDMELAGIRDLYVRAR